MQGLLRCVDSLDEVLVSRKFGQRDFYALFVLNHQLHGCWFGKYKQVVVRFLGDVTTVGVNLALTAWIVGPTVSGLSAWNGIVATMSVSRLSR